MATFTNLYHASDVLKHVLEQELTPPPPGAVPTVIVAPPPDTVTTVEELRVSLLWINEQPTHRNDGYVRIPDGTAAPPPATLSLFVLITAYGQDDHANAVGAHRLLGEVMRVFHAKPVLELPQDGPSGTSGRGKLGLTLVPLTPELMEKLFSPLQIKHRPFVLYEVGPVQLVSRLPTGPVAPVVAPGGVRLSGPTTAAAPMITRLAPHTLAVGGYMRIDGVFASAIDSVWIDGAKFEPLEFDVIDAHGSVGLALPTTGPKVVAEGVHRVLLMSGKLASEPLELRVTAAGSASIDGPKLRAVAGGVPLILRGQGLAAASAVYLWPDSGIRAPDDVVKVERPKLTVLPGSVGFALPRVRPGEYRFAVELTLGPGVPLQFTPFVNLEVTA